MALALLGQGAALLRLGGWAAAPGAALPLVLLALGLAVAVAGGALAVRRGGRGGPGRARLGTVLLLAAELGLVVVAVLGLRLAASGPEAGLEERRRRLQGTAAAVAGQLAGLPRRLTADAERAEALAADEPPFALAAALAAARPAQGPARLGFSYVVWRDGERVGWDERSRPLRVPTVAPDGDPPGRLLQRGWEAWYWREFRPLPLPGDPGALLEIQVRLAPTQEEEAIRLEGVPAEAGMGVGLAVVTSPARRPDRWRGTPADGLSLVRELVLPPDPDGRPLALRVTVSERPWRALRQREAARGVLAAVALWSAAAAGGALLLGGAALLLVALWLARSLAVAIDFFRWLQPAFPGHELPALPGQPASLIDPAYFATPLAGGWFASTADAVLTAALLAVTAVVLGRRLAPRPPTAGGATPPAGARPGRGRRGRPWTGPLPRALLFGIVAGLLLLLLRGLVLEVVRNANPRLIGPKVPVRSFTFWGLHLVLLACAGGGAMLLSGLAARWRRGAGGAAALGAAAVGALGVALAAPGVAPSVAATMVAAVVLWWAAAPAVLGREASLRRLAVLLPLLVAAGWNYAVLAEAYGRTARAWLERKCEQVVQTQSEWVSFLLQDVLVEMADAEATVVPDRGPPYRGELWDDRNAYDLWRLSAIRDLGLPCLVEVLDGEGYTESLFASGFLRDLGYEVRRRSEWRGVASPGAAEADTAASAVLVQEEVRRYPTGREEILRGEIPRRRHDGWIRLELPERSERISTLTAQLEGAPAEPRQGYRPRAEIDRPLLLVRGDEGGWQDAAGGDLPTGPPGVLDELREGRRRWAEVEAGGAGYLSLWCPLPAARAEEPGEGFLLGLQRPTVAEVLLDLSRLVLLDLVLLSGLALPWVVWRLLRHGRTALRLGFQERFLAGYLVVGLALLLLAGAFINRLSLEQLARDSRRQTREGLTAALAQLQGLLAEQARALAESDYVADLLANRLAGRRPLGPFSARQAIVFDAAGNLLLDETLSDLDEAEAALLLEAARSAPLVVMVEGEDVYLGTVIPIELAGEPPGDGHFFYRQRVGGDLVTGLADVVQGEVTLRLDGEAVLASHPEHVFSGRTPLLAPPALMRPLLSRPDSPYLYPVPGSPLAFTAASALPSLSLEEGGSLVRQDLPAVLAVGFPARERDFTEQRDRTALFLAGLATLLLLTAGLLALLMTWKIFGPVRLLAAATRRLAAGDYAAPLPEPGRDEIGTLSGSFRSMRDELRRTRDALAAREQFLRTVLERVPVGVAVFRPDGGLAAVNPAAERILPGFFAAAEEDAADLAPRLWRRLEQALGREPTGEAELDSEDGRRTLRGRVAPLLLPDGEHRMIVFEDVTEFLANKRLALNAELARQVAHEIKNPLTPIQLSIQLLRQAYQDRARDLDHIVEDTVRQILEQVDLLRRIAGEFSLLGRPGELERRPVDLPALARRVLAGYTGAAGGRGVGPQVEIADGAVPPVLGHEESLVKVLGNLMENSLDAVGDPQRLRLRLDWRVSPDEVTLIWEDNGPGLPPALAERLFDPYFSTKSKGTGLGLAICRNLLDKMGGRIGLRNRDRGEGALAEVTLPRADQAGPPGEDSDEDDA